MKKHKVLTTSNLLTVVRLLLTPFVMWAIMHAAWSLAFMLFAAAALTDLLDGYCARFFNEQTYLGEFLDPLADKLLMLGSLFSLAFYHSPCFSIPAWFLGIIAARESVLIVGSVVMYYFESRFQVRPTLVGKATMMLQSLFVLWLFMCHFMQWQPQKTYYVIVGVIVLLALISLAQYARLAFVFVRARFGSD